MCFLSRRYNSFRAVRDASTYGSILDGLNPIVTRVVASKTGAYNKKKWLYCRQAWFRCDYFPVDYARLLCLFLSGCASAPKRWTTPQLFPVMLAPSQYWFFVLYRSPQGRNVLNNVPQRVLWCIIKEVPSMCQVCIVLYCHRVIALPTTGHLRLSLWLPLYGCFFTSCWRGSAGMFLRWNQNRLLSWCI